MKRRKCLKRGRFLLGNRPARSSFRPRRSPPTTTLSARPSTGLYFLTARQRGARSGHLRARLQCGTATRRVPTRPETCNDQGQARTASSATDRGAPHVTRSSRLCSSVFRVFRFFLPSSLKFERADFPLLSLKPEEDFLRARIKERKKKGGGVLCSMMRWVSKRRGVQNARGKYVFVRIRTRSFRLKPTSS